MLSGARDTPVMQDELEAALWTSGPTACWLPCGWRQRPAGAFLRGTPLMYDRGVAFAGRVRVAICSLACCAAVTGSGGEVIAGRTTALRDFDEGSFSRPKAGVNEIKVAFAASLVCAY